MKGVNFSEWECGAEIANRRRVRHRPRTTTSRVITALFLTSLFASSGMALALPSDLTFSMPEISQSRVLFTFGTMTVEIVELASGLLATYTQDGVAHRVAIIDDSEGYRFSIDGGSWRSFSSDLLETPNTPLHAYSAPSSMQDPDFHFNARYWWDGVRFIRGYPAAYPHPDRDYHHIFSKSDWRYWGIQLLHSQFGSDNIGSLVNLGPVGVGIAIGAVVGWVTGGPFGSAAGALVGAIVAGLLSYYYHVVLVDEAGAIWWWINRSLFTAIKNIPWWFWMCGRCVESYIAANIDFLRVGTLTANNDLRIRGP